MSSDNQAEFRGFARVEVMGHQSHCGFVTTEAYGQAVLFRIDRPEIPEHEETLDHADWVGETRCPAGTVVRRAKIDAVTVLVGSGSIYRIIPCTEEAARKAIINESERRPLSVVRLPESVQIAEVAPRRRRIEDDNDPYEDGPDDEEKEDLPIVAMTPEALYDEYREHFTYLTLPAWISPGATERVCWTEFLYALKAA
jgi:hypothetical protein